MATKRIRIAVAVTAGGDWYAYGESGVGRNRADEDMRGMALECVEADPRECHVVYVEADVPLPERVTIEGEVRDGE